MGETQNRSFQLSFNPALKIEFQGSRVTSDGGLILVRELDERLGVRYVANPFDGGEAYDGVILAVPHAAYRKRSVDDFLGCVRPRGVLMDVRGILPRVPVEAAGVRYWRL